MQTIGPAGMRVLVAKLSGLRWLLLDVLNDWSKVDLVENSHVLSVVMPCRVVSATSGSGVT